MQENGKKQLVVTRRFFQLLFFSLFIFLFVQTDYKGYDQLEYAVNILFRLDPFLAAVTVLSIKTTIALMLPSLVVIFASFILGRSFCGWFCPMGSLLDGCRKSFPTDRFGKETVFPNLGLWLLLISLFSGYFGLYLAGYVDPFSILVRGFVLTLYPAFHLVIDSFFSFTYQAAPGWVNTITESAYTFFQEDVLPSEQKHFELVFFSGGILAAIVLLEIGQKRFFCRNICPLGALLGQIAKRGLFRGRGGNDECGKCRICSSVCRMGAVDTKRKIDMSFCNLCLECTVTCPKKIISFGFAKPKPDFADHRYRASSMSRRQFLGAALAGALLPQVKGSHVFAKHSEPQLIRPPGACFEQEFLARCVRCGECMQVCIGNALQPVFLQAGVDGMFTPILSARYGYCEFNCTLCGQVCPTGALKPLSLDEKRHFKIGHAHFDTTLCLPYAKGIPCIVCEEHCPTAEKAIKFHDVKVFGQDGSEIVVKQPYIVDDLCIGCGICEYKCPLPGRAAVYVTSAGEQRHPEKSIPSQVSVPY